MTSDKQTINTTEQCPWDAEHHLVTSYQHLSSTLSLQLIETHLSASMIISGDYWKENMLMQRLKKTTISLCSVVGRSSVKIYSIIDEPEKSFKNIFFQLALCMQRWKIFLSHTTKLKSSLEIENMFPILLTNVFIWFAESACYACKGEAAVCTELCFTKDWRRKQLGKQIKHLRVQSKMADVNLSGQLKR